MNKTILFLFLAFGVFEGAQAEETPTHEDTQKVDLTKKICEAYEAGRFEETIKLGNEFIKISPNSPNLPSAYLLIARSQYNLGKWTEAIDAYRKAQATSTDNDVKEEASNFILKATTAQAETASKKSEGTKDVSYSGPTLSASPKQILEKFGPPSETQNGKPLYRKGDFVIMIGFTAGENPVANNILYKKNKGSVFSRDEVEQLLKNNWGKLTYDEIDGSGMNMPGSRVFRLQKIHSFMARFTPAENILFFLVTDDQKRAESAKQSVGNL